MTDSAPAAQAVDLSDILPADTAVIEILKPGGTEGTGWHITIAGPSHQKTIAWADQAARRSLRRQSQIEAAQANGRKYKPDERNPAEVRRDNVAWVVARIIDWTPIKIGGEVFTFSEAGAVDLLSRPEMGWAFAQIVDFVAEERSFTRPSAIS